ncbi:hypothetical protein EVAR_2551_1 [Eumeta japonica]|uniref:Uncharacterized protein n=1 Tax=Eumeta variegata TaxID=151549 RepID=A0A4C1SNY6_EUMVA|nr:hypothetical protein EVAR_2551_1 [Eumeta japonica]
MRRRNCCGLPVGIGSCQASIQISLIRSALADSKHGPDIRRRRSRRRRTKPNIVSVRRHDGSESEGGIKIKSGIGVRVKVGRQIDIKGEKIHWMSMQVEPRADLNFKITNYC